MKKWKNKEIINKNINDTNFFDSEELDNPKQNLKYEESNFNFYVIDKDKRKEKRSHSRSKDKAK